MSDYFSSGVIIKEIGSESKPISGASTSIAAFVGSAASGPFNEAVLVSSYSEFEIVFGGFISSPRQYLAYSVDMFFKNGGRSAYIVRAAGTQEPDCDVDDVVDAPRDYEAALSALEKVYDAGILVIPGEFGADIYDKMITHCEKMKYRVAILDPEQGIGIAEVRSSRADEMSSERGYAALYYPWLKITDPITEEIISVPPGGAVAGVYARVDNKRGVHKAPANEELLGLDGLDVQLTTENQALLNPDGINAIRFIKGSGNLVWGARTISNDPLWRYINVRRLFIYLEQSIYNSTRWVVFEPNNEKLWGKVRTTVTDFLMRAWRDGMLAGSTSGEAFYVKCDLSTMTQSDIDSGKLIIEIGVAPVKPAEYVVFRIVHMFGSVFSGTVRYCQL